MYKTYLAHVALGLASGLLFGAGLLISGMANPAKVLNFLDVLGHWDPSLAFVMGGAVACTVVGYPLVQRRARPMFSLNFELPTRRDVDRPLIVGAVLFGLGWGVSGYCPGPLWTSLAGLAPGTLIFAAFMVLGMWGTALRKQRQTD
ncbi:MAG: DUF6691 family protein [Granulosicoccus sp.]